MIICCFNVSSGIIFRGGRGEDKCTVRLYVDRIVGHSILHIGGSVGIPPPPPPPPQGKVSIFLPHETDVILELICTCVCSLGWLDGHPISSAVIDHVVCLWGVFLTGRDMYYFMQIYRFTSVLYKDPLQCSNLYKDPLQCSI